MSFTVEKIIKSYKIYGNKMSYQDKIVKFRISNAKFAMLNFPISAFNIVIICTKLAA